ncbi:hypothetical protein HDU81_002466 [Chytriomyces hyalinus]|nr:hypothetical protein HDU81_002466 [Chytriomyces hyalinus]
MATLYDELDEYFSANAVHSLYGAMEAVLKKRPATSVAEYYFSKTGEEWVETVQMVAGRNGRSQFMKTDKKRTIDDVFSQIEARFSIIELNPDAFNGNNEELVSNPMCEPTDGNFVNYNKRKATVTVGKKQRLKKRDYPCQSNVPHFYVEYMKLLEQQLSAHSEPAVQFAKHVFESAKWFCFNSDFLSMLEVPLVLQPESKEKVLLGVDQALQQLLERKAVFDVAPNSVFSRIVSCFSKPQQGVMLKNLVVILALQAAYTYTAVPRQSGLHPRIELWGLFCHTVLNLESGPLVPGYAGKSSAQSDFAAAAVDSRDGLTPFLIVRFGTFDSANYKDDHVCVAEGAYQMNELIGKLNLSTAELGQLKIYLGFVNDTRLRFDVLSPRYDQKTVSSLFLVLLIVTYH